MLRRVHAEHGAKASIIEVNRVRTGGVAGFFSREEFEVIVEPPAPRAERVEEAPRQGRRREDRAVDEAAGRSDPVDVWLDDDAGYEPWRADVGGPDRPVPDDGDRADGTIAAGDDLRLLLQQAIDAAADEAGAAIPGQAGAGVSFDALLERALEEREEAEDLANARARALASAARATETAAPSPGADLPDHPQPPATPPRPRLQPAAAGAIGTGEVERPGMAGEDAPAGTGAEPPVEVEQDAPVGTRAEPPVAVEEGAPVGAAGPVEVEQDAPVGTGAEPPVGTAVEPPVEVVDEGSGSAGVAAVTIDLVEQEPAGAPVGDTFWDRIARAGDEMPPALTSDPRTVGVIGPLRVLLPLLDPLERNEAGQGRRSVVVLTNRAEIISRPAWRLHRDGIHLLNAVSSSLTPTLVVIDIDGDLPIWVRSLVGRLRRAGMELLRLAVPGPADVAALRALQATVEGPVVFDLLTAPPPAVVLDLLERGLPIGSVDGVELTAELLVALRREAGRG